MANKIYVGEEGAKELYRKIKALIPGAVTVVDEVSLNSMDAVTSHAVAVAVGNLTGFQPVDGTGEDNHPDVAEPNTRTIYLVKIPEIVGEDKYKEWIWVIPEQGAGSWECIGSTSIPENAWKQWSEDNGSSGVGDSVYLGKNNTLTRNDTYALGKGNTATITDATDYSNTDVVMIGTSNSATNAANTYQLGRENTVDGNNLEFSAQYPHSMALNLGRNNTITGEGVNIGKDNESTRFGINIGQNSSAANASCSIGSQVRTDDASIAMGNGIPSTNNPTVPDVPSLLINSKYEPINKFRIKNTYELYDCVAVEHDTDTDTYKWAHIRPISIDFYPNYELNQYLVSWGSVNSTGPYTGYFDENGQWVPSDDPSKDIHQYTHISRVGNASGSEKVDVNFFTNGESAIKAVKAYLLRSDVLDEDIPMYGTILTKAEYDEFTSKCVYAFKGIQWWSNLFVNPKDLTADAFSSNSFSNDLTLPFVSTYEVYGYKDNDVLIPYNETNKNSDHTFDWYEVNATDVKSQTMPVSQVDPKAKLITAVNRSAIFGMGSAYASGQSLVLASNFDNTYQIKYKNTPITYVYRSYSHNTRYTISQSDGRVTSTGNITISQFAVPKVTDYTNSVTPGCAYAEGGSIVISPGYSTAFGSSVSIGDYANSSDKGYVFGPSSSAFNDAYSFGYAVSSRESSLAFGYSGTNATKQSFAIGISGVSSYKKSMSIGFEGLYASDNSIALGFSGSAIQRGMSIGYSNIASADGIAIGRYNDAYSEALTIGASNTLSYQNIALGFYNQMQDTTDSTIHTTLIGVSNNSGHGGYNIGIGESNTSSHEAISIGRNNKAYGWSIALGVNNSTSNGAGGHATIIGYENTSSSTLANIEKLAYGLMYGIPLDEQNAIYDYSSNLVDCLSNNDLPGVKTVITSIYNIINKYVTDPELDSSYADLMAITSISEYFDIYDDSVFKIYYGNIYYAHSANPPGYGQTPTLYECNSVIMGTYNTANHYNSILIGMLNTSIAPLVESSKTDDDGFTVAIGFKNVVERNYDMAIGYQSVAKGGENIAITNSEAIGYRNLAYNHSKVNGICNILLNESVLDCKRWDDEPLKIEYNTFNTLNNSNVSYKCVTESESNTGVTFFGNHFEGVRCELVASDCGVHANVMLGNGPIIDNSYSTVSVDPDIKIAAGTISNNIIADSIQHFEIALGNKDASNSIEHNLFMFNDVQMRNIKHLRQNTFISSVFNIEMDSNAINRGDFRDNVILNSTITGTPNGPGGVKTNGMNQNIIAGNSRVYLDNTPGTLWNNVVICTSKLTANHDSTIWSNDSDGIVSNFLFGSNAKKVLACVSFGDGGDTDIENAMYSRNFGDNTLYNTNNVFVSGNGNEFNAVQHSVVFGDENMFTSKEYAGRKNVTTGMLHMSEIYVFGLKNSIRHAAGEYFSRIFMSGSGNTIDGNNVHDSAIFGSDNKLCHFGNTLPSQMSVDAVWALSVSKPTYIEVTEDGYLPGTGTNTCTIFGNKVYYYRDGAAYTVWSGAPSGVTVVEISGTNLYQGIINKTLIDGTYYKATSYPSGNSTVPELNSISKHEYCIKYPDGTTSVKQPTNIGVSILGNVNCISPNVMWSHVLGTDITISNELKYGISGLFVQGMNQTVSDGSNIICMGAGNVSSGHGSIAIGNQLISDKWQTVIGKYNEALPGPERIIPTHDENKTYKAGDIVYDSLGSTYYKCTSSVPTVGMMQNSLWAEVDPDSEKALFIVGNGYGESDGSDDWNDETKIHRSNAMVVYADGTVKAKKFVSEEPELELTEGAGIQINKNITAGTLTVSVKQPLPAAPSNPGTYALQCVVDTNGNPTYSWVSVGITNV